MTDSATTAMRLAGLGAYADVPDEGSICFVSDRSYRTCSACGTVFVVSAWLTGLAGVGKCPFCGCHTSIPIKEVQ